MDDVLVLIGADIQTNDLMEQVEGDSVRSEVFGRVESVTRAEWFDGGREGMKPALVFITPAVNYSGEPEAELHGVRYRSYRTYRKRDTDEVELHLEEKAGVAHG